MRYGLLVITLLSIGLLFVAGCTTGQASTPPSGPVGGGCGVGAPAGNAIAEGISNADYAPAA